MTDLEICPKCDFKFSKAYARVVACSDCESSTQIGGCGFIKCPACGFEYQDKKFPDKFLKRKEYKQFH